MAQGSPSTALIRLRTTNICHMTFESWMVRCACADLRCARLPLRSRWVIPLSVALAALDGVGHGQGVFGSKHSTAISKRRQHHEEVSESHPARRSQNLKQQQPEHRPHRHPSAAQTADRERSDRGQRPTPDRAIGAGTLGRFDCLPHRDGPFPSLFLWQHFGDCETKV